MFNISVNSLFLELPALIECANGFSTGNRFRTEVAGESG